MEQRHQDEEPDALGQGAEDGEDHGQRELAGHGARERAHVDDDRLPDRPVPRATVPGRRRQSLGHALTLGFVEPDGDYQRRPAKSSGT